jgi:transposase-like protein
MGRNTERVDATLERAAASNYWTEAEAQAVLEAWEASGLSVAEFARRHGLGSQRLRWWKKRRAEEAGPALSFVPVHVAPPSPEAQRAEGTAVAVGTALRLIDSGRPPHRSQRALLTHWALASDADVKAYCRLA